MEKKAKKKNARAARPTKTLRKRSGPKKAEKKKTRVPAKKKAGTITKKRTSGKTAGKTTKSKVAKKRKPVAKAKPAKKKAARKKQPPPARKPAKKKAVRKKIAKKAKAIDVKPAGRVRKTAIAGLVEPLALQITNPNWQAVAHFDNTGSPVTTFTCTMVVPAPPAARTGQTIMAFIGLQAGQRILQPILQWGRSQMTGGGPFWTVGSCLARGQITLERASVLTRVNPGRTLRAVIRLLSSEGNRFRYSCFFEDVVQSRIDTPAIDELTNCCVTLEAARINSRAHYPAAPFIPVSEVVVGNRDRILVPSWRLEGVSRHGEQAVLQRMPGTPDRIDLRF